MTGAIIIEGHVQGLSNARSLGEGGIPVYVVDKTDCIARYSRFCKKFFKCPDFSEDSFAYFLLELAEKEDIYGWVLIPSNDHAVFTIAKHKESLSRYFKVITPSSEIISKIYDKFKLFQIAESAHIPIPRTYLAVFQNYNSIPKDLFPILIKGRFGLSFYKVFKKKAFPVQSEHELGVRLNSIKSRFETDNILIQELIQSNGSNKTISFTAFCEEGRLKAYWMGVKLREHPLSFGTATFAQSIIVHECYEQSVPLLEALNYSGVCEIEYLFDPKDKKYKLIEINARTWLWVGLARACGVDYPKMIYNYVNGIQNNYPMSYESGIKWRNSVTDIIFTSLALLKGKINLKTITEQNKGNIVDAISYHNDNKPLWAYIYLLLTFFFRR